MAPSRSTNVTVVNELNNDLTVSTSLDHGEWTQGLHPPNVIRAKSRVTFQSESAGVATGTEGRATLTTGGNTFKIYWDNPFSGSNDYSQERPDGYDISRSGGSGDNAEVTFTICKLKITCILERNSC